MRNATETVGVRDLRQNLSHHLSRAKVGERLVLADHNKPVAVLAPLSEYENSLKRLIAEGRATLPTNAKPISEIQPIDIDDLRAGTNALKFVRGERDYSYSTE